LVSWKFTSCSEGSVSTATGVATTVAVEVETVTGGDVAGISTGGYPSRSGWCSRR
jgi:hypothetical protein